MKQNIGNTIEGINVPLPCASFFLSLNTPLQRNKYQVLKVIFNQWESPWNIKILLTGGA